MTEVFPFKPNWSKSVELTLSYKTDTFVSRSGIEQRRALRSTPRRSIGYQTLTYFDSMVAFNRLLARNQNADFLMPDWTVPSVRAKAVSAGVSFVVLEAPAPEWIVQGATVFLIDGDTVLSAVVSKVPNAYRMNLTAPVSTTMTSRMVVRRSMTGLLGGIQGTANTSQVVTASVTFDAAPGSYSPTTAGSFQFVTGGKEVFPFPWNWAESVSTAFDWPIEVVDFGRGVTLNHRPVNFGTATQKVTVVRQRMQVDLLHKFLDRQKGKRGEFLMPSGTSDLTLASTIADGATALTVVGTDAAQFDSDLVYVGVAICLHDGRKVFRRVESIVTSSGNSVITVSEPISYTITASQVAKISWLRSARLTSDDATLEYLTDSTVQWQTGVTSVTFANDTLNYATLDAGSLWIMDNWGEGADEIYAKMEYLVGDLMTGHKR